MSPDQWLESQRRKIPQLLNAINQEIITVHFESIQRIYTDGKLGDDGNRRFQYKGKALYVNPTKSPKIFPVGGKPGAKRDIKNRKTRYFTSYAAYRAAIGRNPTYVDLTLSGLLRADHTASLRRTSDITWEARLKNPRNVPILEGLTDRYGHFTDYNKKETDNLTERINIRRGQIGI